MTDCLLINPLIYFSFICLFGLLVLFCSVVVSVMGFVPYIVALFVFSVIVPLINKNNNSGITLSNGNSTCQSYCTAYIYIYILLKQSKLTPKQNYFTSSSQHTLKYNWLYMKYYLHTYTTLTLTSKRDSFPQSTLKTCIDHRRCIRKGTN